MLNSTQRKALTVIVAAAVGVGIFALAAVAFGGPVLEPFNFPAPPPPTWGDIIHTIEAKLPSLKVWELLLGMRGIAGLLLFPIHTMLDTYIKNNVGDAQYAKAVHRKNAASPMWNLLDLTCNYLLSIRPTMILIASQVAGHLAMPPEAPPSLANQTVKSGDQPQPLE